MALADGKSSFKTGPITLHTRTAIHIAEKLANVSMIMFNILSHFNLLEHFFFQVRIHKTKKVYLNLILLF